MDGKGKGGEVVSSWSKLGPRVISRFPGVRALCLDVICGSGASFQSGCVLALGRGQTNPRDVFDFQEYPQTQGFVLKDSRVGVWSPVGQVSPLTCQPFRDPGGSGTAGEGL